MQKDWEGTKKQLRDNLRSLQGGELLWQKLQGRVYGICMSQATMFPGVSQFLMRCKNRGNTVFIVSHKTEFGHYDPTKTSLRIAALDWMKSNGFFKKERFGLSKDHVFFEKTCKEKVKRISSLDLDVFVDDLEEVFMEDDFPDINKILFGKTYEGSNYSILCENWNDITNEVLGPITNEECKELAQSILDENVSEVRKLEGRGNSRIYRVVTQSKQIYALKNYPDLLIDSRNRLQTEVQSFRFLEDFYLTPKVVAFDVDLNMALYEWIEGKPLTIIENEHVDQVDQDHRVF
ncbi:MAG TPA: phosphotransferase enzyme domain protein, partial [Sulfurimonas sp.]|nr:phosphotransferase enzyme domain protein [Sulfurimonas sp.]